MVKRNGPVKTTQRKEELLRLVIKGLEELFMDPGVLSGVKTAVRVSLELNLAQPALGR